jgi:hypothetical protein
MSKTETERLTNANAPKLFMKFTELMGWLQIFAALFLTGLLLGLVAYLTLDNEVGFIVGLSLSVLGFVAGVIWATRVYRKTGTSRYLTRMMATPDVDANTNK